MNDRKPKKKTQPTTTRKKSWKNTKKNFYFNLVLFMFASQLYIYILSHGSLLGY